MTDKKEKHIEIPEFLSLPTQAVIADLANTSPWVAEAVIAHLHTAEYISRMDVVLQKGDVIHSAPRQYVAGLDAGSIELDSGSKPGMTRSWEK